ncbi:DUF4231 domain-containing protein [Sandarakinorhabdus sp. AAP62]|uniref:DUF4231 domain-containing protein n=1 Tax=Sandarakinorhabdus sp. AAP62 TaxID=1248916 RepID=UPI000475BF03|nr:DUF4231 domain-containing protein [Sandarakinorhabdus sp. AAP62]
MAEPSPLAVPPLPLPVLSLGVTGHRANNALFVAHEPRIAAVMEEIFTAIAAAAGSAQVRLHSLLADGTDQLAAHGALARGWDLVAPLPFGRALNQAINAHPASPADARLLLAGQPARAADTATRADAIAALEARARLFELGDADTAIAALYLAMVDAPTDVAAAQRYASAASRRVALAGRVMIEQSDLIIAVWDGVSRDAVGGTGHTLASALVAGAAVVLIDCGNPEGWRLVTDLEALDQVAEQAPDPHARASALAATIAAALHPADEGTEAAMALAPSAWRATSNPLFHGYRRVETLFGGGGRPWRSLRMVHERPDAIASGSGAAMLQALTNLPGADPAWPRAVGQAVLQRFAWADGISTRFSDLYRGGMVANFLASGAAVLAGLAYLPTAGPEWKHVFAALEFLLLGTIVLTTWLATRYHWHDHWFETRRAAEYLRHAPFLMALGVVRPAGRWPKGGHGERAAWPEYHARHAVREVGLPPVRVGQSWLRAVLDGLLIPHLASQRDYHRIKARRLDTVHHRLDRVSTISFQLAVVAVALWLLFWLGGILGVFPEQLAEKTAKLFTFLGVMFPTIGGAVAGIRYFGDFDRFAAISRISAEKLDAVHRRATLLRAAPDHALDYGALSDLAHAADDVVVSEIESWQAVFAGKHFTVPV